jgi:glycosyltransferase involved in cell wall biosynthesis
MGGGGVLRMAKLVKYLPQNGWTASVVASEEARPEVVDESLLAEIPSGIDVRRVRGPMRAIGIGAKHASDIGARSRADPVRRLTNFGKIVVRSVTVPDRWIGWARVVAGLPADTLGAPDVILSSGPPHSAHLAARRLARRLGVPFVMDLRDDWAGNPFHRNPAPWHAALERRLEARCIRSAAAVVHVSAESAAGYAQRYVGTQTRFVAIPNGFDPDDIVGLERRVAATSDRPVRFVFAGSLRGSQEVGDFFLAFGGWAGQEGTVGHLSLIGSIAPEFAREARASVAPRALTIQGPASHAEALSMMAGADVLVVFTGGGGAGTNTMTSKIFEYLAMRRPILLVGPAGPAADLVVAANAGFVTRPGDLRSIQHAISAAADLAMSPAFTGMQQDILDLFDRRNQARTWAALFLEVAGSRGSVAHPRMR